MNCCQCQGIEELFSQEYVNKEVRRYRTKGPYTTTRMLVESIKAEGVTGQTLLDIGGGVGAIQNELLQAGVEHATDVEASKAYINAAKEEAQRHGYAGRVNFYHGNFVELAADLPPADIVTLDRVICCYPDMENMVSLSATRARKLFGLVYPRDTWWIKAGLALQNFYFKLRRIPYRGFVHPTRAVEAVLKDKGLKRRTYHQTMIWQVVIFARQ